MNDYWLRQDPKSPLFGDLLWSRPQQKSQAGNLLIVGGNVHGINAPNLAYSSAQAAGVGTAKVVMPSATKRLLPHGAHADVEFVLSTPTGSFSQKSVGDIKNYMLWANATLFAGDFSRNSETTIVLENLCAIPGQHIYTKDAIDYFSPRPQLLLDRPDTLLVATFAQIQKLASESGLRTPFVYEMGAVRIAAALYELNSLHSCHFAMIHEGQVYCVSGGRLVTTRLGQNPSMWRIPLAAYMAVWWLQNPSKPLEALTNASLHYAEDVHLLD